jgi:hypothetical protein
VPWIVYTVNQCLPRQRGSCFIGFLSDMDEEGHEYEGSDGAAKGQTVELLDIQTRVTGTVERTPRAGRSPATESSNSWSEG